MIIMMMMMMMMMLMMVVVVVVMVMMMMMMMMVTVMDQSGLVAEFFLSLDWSSRSVLTNVKHPKIESMTKR